MMQTPETEDEFFARTYWDGARNKVFLSNDPKGEVWDIQTGINYVEWLREQQND